MLSPSEKVAEVEAEIERLSVGVGECRKVEVAAKAAMVVGGLSLVALMIGVIQSNPVVLVVGIAAVLGGLVLFGSNRTTLDEMVETMRKHETSRIDMIDELELRAVND